jgi:Centrosome microtubule-binding domain of Cep57
MKNIPLQSWLHPPGNSTIPLVNSDVQKIIDGLAKHNAASCTVCSRKRKSKGTKSGIHREPLYEVHVNDYTAPLYEEGESIRPSVPPKQAISTVLSQLKDEFHHLKLYLRLNNSNNRQYQTLTTQYEGLDPGHGKRKRKTIADKLRDVLEEFEAKADQIYALYDVVEGARQGMGAEARSSWLEL